MAKSLKVKPNGKPARKIASQTLLIIKGILIFIGKPFYLFIIYFLIFILFGLYSIGHGLLKFFSLLSEVLKNLRFPQFKITVPKIRISLPKITIPKLKLERKFQIRLNIKQVVFLLFLILFSLSFWFFILRGLPSPKDLVTREKEVSTKIYDRNRVLLYKIYKNKNRTIIPLSKIPKSVIYATLAAEDAEFYNHPGFSIRGITRALITNFKKGKLSGGSTITQQLVKNALLTPEKTIVRKIKEIILSIAVELTYSKDQILEMYLNEVSYGGAAYGIEEASQIYFAKDAWNLNSAEAALLAGLPKSPSKYSPFGPNPELTLERQKEVINLMAINKYISSEEATKISQEKIVFAPNRIEIKAPHFVMYVKQILAERYGEDLVERGGLEVTTTLNYDIQKMAEGVVKNEVNKLSSYRVGNGAALIINPQKGEILAMVGSKDYFATQGGGNVNVTLAPRQPGSSIKIINYAYALEHGYTLATILEDSAVSFQVPGSPLYSPKNYDGKYRGRLPLRNALAESRNIPAVKVLATYGVGKMIEQGRKMGITTWKDPANYGLSLTLGGGEIKLIDLATAYATIANLGEKPEIYPISKVTDYKGKTLEEKSGFDNVNKKVVDPRVAFLLIEVLKDNAARSPAFGLNSSLVIKGHPEVAVKTGTSNNLKDNLTIGFNQDFLVATWVGNNDGSPMSQIASGITGAAPIFNKIMTNLVKDKKPIDWTVPDGLIKVNICPLTGTLPCEGCLGKNEWFLSETKPKNACVFKKEEINPNQILEEGARVGF